MMHRVEDDDGDKEDGNPDSRIHKVCIDPKGYHQRRCDQLIWGDDSILQPISTEVKPMRSDGSRIVKEEVFA
jgi:hypothetical protein